MSGGDYKKRIQSAIEKYHKKHDPTVVRRKNDHPEARIVKEIYEHLNTIGWSLDWYESKATFDPGAQRYMSSQMRVGHSDLAGNTPDGFAVYIEVKNKGRMSALRQNQREFLIDKINTNCFAIVADSVELVLDIYNRWLNSNNKKNLLLNSLPPQKKQTHDDFSNL